MAQHYGLECICQHSVVMTSGPWLSDALSHRILGKWSTSACSVKSHYPEGDYRANATAFIKTV